MLFVTLIDLVDLSDRPSEFEKFGFCCLFYIQEIAYLSGIQTKTMEFRTDCSSLKGRPGQSHCPSFWE
jgi:hypothetical protein